MTVNGSLRWKLDPSSGIRRRLWPHRGESQPWRTQNGLAELYAVDARGRVLLKKLPAATSHQLRDTVLLLLYGGLTMCGETSESGYRLVQAVRGMGLRIERVPRKFGPGSELAISFGRHRGKRYRLTAGGIRYCEQLIPGLLRWTSRG